MRWWCPVLLSMRKVFVLKDPRGPIFKSLSSRKVLALEDQFTSPCPRGPIYKSLSSNVRVLILGFQVLVLRPQVLCPCPRALSPCPFPCPQVLENITMVSSWLTQHTGSVSGLEASAGVWLTATESGDQLWALVAWL